MPVPRSKKKPTKSKKAPEGFKSGPQEKRLLDKLASICGLKRHAPKMCEVFMEFVEPYHEILNTEEDFSRLLPVAQAAWNAALLPDPDRKEVLMRLSAERLLAQRRHGGSSTTLSFIRKAIFQKTRGE